MIPYIESSAVLSEGGCYRYSLTRAWGHGPRSLVVIGLNPSTADAEQDDPTIRRCVRFAIREHCERLVMVNLYALRSRRPEALWVHEDPVGPENDATLKRWLGDRSATVVAAWGAGDRKGRARQVAEMAPELYCLGVTQAGHPRHPLYLQSSSPLVRWSIDDDLRDMEIARTRLQELEDDPSLLVSGPELQQRLESSDRRG